MTDHGETVLLTPGEVARMFRVDPKTVTRWARNGLLTSFRTLGGHRRFNAHEVASLIVGRKKLGAPAAPAGDRTAGRIINVDGGGVL